MVAKCPDPLNDQSVGERNPPPLIEGSFDHLPIK
jgi:hypothetical protein